MRKLISTMGQARLGHTESGTSKAKVQTLPSRHREHPDTNTLQAHVSSLRRLRHRAIAVDGVSLRLDQRSRPPLGAGPLGP